MARREACATILEDIVLQMQTIMEGDIDAAVSVVGEDTQVILAFIWQFVLGLCQLQEGERVNATFVRQRTLASATAPTDKQIEIFKLFKWKNCFFLEGNY